MSGFPVSGTQYSAVRSELLQHVREHMNSLCSGRRADDTIHAGFGMYAVGYNCSSTYSIFLLVICLDKISLQKVNEKWKIEVLDYRFTFQKR